MSNDKLSLPSGRLFSFVFLLLTLNALPPFISEAYSIHGALGAALNLFDVSAIVWLAVAAGLTLLWQSDPGLHATKADIWIVGLAIFAAILPVPPLSGVFMSVIAGWCLFRWREASSIRRGGAVFLALSGFFFWGRLLLAVGSGPLLSADGGLVAWAAGTSGTGNAVAFSDGTRFLIAPGCSSLHGVSLAIILWTAAVAWFDERIDARLLLTLAFAIMASIAVNLLRLTVIALHPADFDYWHVRAGAQMFGWLGMIVIGAVVYAGFSRRSSV